MYPGQGRRGRDNYRVLRIVRTGRVAKLHRIAAFQAESEATLWAVQRPRAPHDDAFEICWVAGVQSPLERLEGTQVYQADSSLPNAFAVSAALVTVSLLVAIGRVRRNGNTRLLVSSRETHSEASPYSRGKRRANAILEASIGGLSGSKNGFAK